MNALSPPPLVLIADAEPYICRVFEAKLVKNNQFRVVCAHAGPEAFQAALLQPFDVILWDLRLRDSERLLPGLRALSPQAALLLMTTDDLPRLSAEITRLDVADVLTKPFGLDLLIERVRVGMSRASTLTSIAHMDLGRVGQQLAIYSQEGRCVTRVLESGANTFAVVGAPRVTTPSDFAPGRRVTVQVQGRDALYCFHT
ncbi:MAG TPA: response regulator, partial [Chthonomonadaceae bacterium]|nr:response regulator [Chthonomonadaceae bacterium]